MENYAPASSALYPVKDSATTWFSSASSYGQTDAGYMNALAIDASRSSSLYGKYQTTRESIIPDHIAVIAWKRIA